MYVCTYIHKFINKDSVKIYVCTYIHKFINKDSVKIYVYISKEPDQRRAHTQHTQQQNTPTHTQARCRVYYTYTTHRQARYPNALTTHTCTHHTHITHTCTHHTHTTHTCTHHTHTTHTKQMKMHFTHMHTPHTHYKHAHTTNMWCTRMH